MASVNWVENQIKETTSKINEYAEEHDGEISDELLAELDQWEGAKEGAIEEMAIEYKTLIAKSSMVKVQVKALQQINKEVDEYAESVRKSIGLVLQGEKFKSANSAISYRKSSSVHIYDENLLPAEFIHTKEVVSISKADIKKALKG